VDGFDNSCFVVEDKPGLFDRLGTDISELNNGITLVKPRKNDGQKNFVPRRRKTIKICSQGNSP